jgi:hypothetical protein
MHKEDEMRDIDEIAVVYFIEAKTKDLNSFYIPSIERLNQLLSDANTLELPASAEQITKFIDRYYPKEQE